LAISSSDQVIAEAEIGGRVRHLAQPRLPRGKEMKGTLPFIQFGKG
jgi:hypothetical protein